MKRSIVLLMLVVLAMASQILPAAAAEQSPAATVEIKGSSFVPAVVRIKAGQEVAWRNEDAAPHTVAADDESFDSGTLNKGDVFKRVFTKSGTYKYSCGMHAWMAGTVEVE